MNPAALLLLLLAGSGLGAREDGGEAAPAVVTRVLLAMPEFDARAFARAVEELAVLPDAEETLLTTLGAARAPLDGAALGPRQLELVWTALERRARARLDQLVADAARAAVTPEQSSAAVRVLGARARAADLGLLLAVARRAEDAGRFDAIEVPLGDALRALFASSPALVERMDDRWKACGPATASCAVRAVEGVRSRAAFVCLRALLGRRSELDACVLQALGNLGTGADPEQRADLAAAAVNYLDSSDRALVLAAASAIGRLAVPETIPALIEVLGHDDRACARASLTALRAVGGVSLPASPLAWRAWYAREESWWQERAPEMLRQLVAAVAAPVGDVSGWLREISEHPLHRDALGRRLQHLLQHPEPSVRVLVCECLARLGSRTGVGALRETLADPAPEVVTAARAALGTLAPEDCGLTGLVSRTSRRGSADP